MCQAARLWTALGWGIIKSIGAIVITTISLKIVNYLLDRTSRFAQNFDNISQNDESISSFFESLTKNINAIVWIAIVILCAQFLLLPSIVTKYLFIVFRIYLIIISGLLIFKTVVIIVDSLDALSVKYYDEDNLLRLYVKLQYLIPFLKRCLEYIVYVGMATLVLQQIDFIAQLAQLGLIGIKLITIFLGGRILISIVGVVIDEFLLNAKNLKVFIFLLAKLQTSQIGQFKESRNKLFIFSLVAFYSLSSIFFSFLPSPHYA